MNAQASFALRGRNPDATWFSASDRDKMRKRRQS
jgi:hypothetical protein